MSTFLLKNVYNFSSICLPLLDSSSFSGWRAKASCCTIYIQNTSGRLSREVSSELSIHVNSMTSDVIAPSSWKIFGCQNGRCDFSFFHYYPNICILYYSFDVFAFFLGLRLFKEAKEVNPRGKKVSHCFNFNRL